MVITRNHLSVAFLVLTLAAVGFFMPTIKNPTSAKHGWVVGSQLLQPFLISNPPLLRASDGSPSDYKPFDLAQMRGEWVLAIIGPWSYTPTHVKYELRMGPYGRAIKRHFQNMGLKPPHISGWRLDDLRGYETYLQQDMYERLRDPRGDDSIGITSYYLNGAGNTYNKLFMQWIQRTDSIAVRNRDTSRDRVVDPHDRLGHIEETYPIAILIDPEGFVQAYWREFLPMSYTLYRTIRDMQEKYAAAKVEQAIIDGSASAMKESSGNE